MTAGPSRSLTERQQAVMERIDRRVPIKVIAQELGVSETRVNQHIRALKDIFEAENLGELVERYRATLPEEPAGQGDPAGSAETAAPSGETPREKGGDADSLKGLSEVPYSKSQVPGIGSSADNDARVDHGELVMSDVMPLIDQAPWLGPKEPKVVPGLLDGDNAVLFRLAAIVAIAFGCLAAVVLTVNAAMTISEVLEGRATVPVDEQGFS